ncbi:glycosyltransferase family A protein [Micromonospora sp. NPDC049171]|uniref:glycosyltransferase family 2 protein n=1 Tax=Micromonospora sp. NPDC049171 TaxID=3155770 RepID=UPI0033DB7696
MNPLVSVIVPSYNSIVTLELCLRSVATQTYQPIELIVVDDASTDGSAQVARAMGATVVGTGSNSGQSVARNLGAEHATGEILFFLDSDVALDPTGVEIAVSVLRDQPGVGAICGVYDAEPLLPGTLATRYRTAQQYVWFNEVEGTIPGLHTALFAIRAEVFAETGPFDPRLRHTEDQDYGYRLGRRYDVRVTTEIRGRHDHDATLRTILRKVFHRTRMGMPLWLRHRTLPGGAATGSRALASVAVAGAAAALPLPLLVGPVGAVATPALVATAIGLDAATYRHVFATGGVGFGVYFTAVQLLVTLTAAVAAGVGVAQYALTRRPGPPQSHPTSHANA